MFSIQINFENATSDIRQAYKKRRLQNRKDQGAFILAADGKRGPKDKIRLDDVLEMFYHAARQITGLVRAQC